MPHERGRGRSGKRKDAHERARRELRRDLGLHVEGQAQPEQGELLDRELVVARHPRLQGHPMALPGGAGQLLGGVMGRRQGKEVVRGEVFRRAGNGPLRQVHR